MITFFFELVLLICAFNNRFIPLFYSDSLQRIPSWSYCTSVIIFYLVYSNAVMMRSSDSIINLTLDKGYRV